jgi:hypothetical protein
MPAIPHPQISTTPGIAPTATVEVIPVANINVLIVPMPYGNVLKVQPTNASSGGGGAGGTRGYATD